MYQLTAEKIARVVCGTVLMGSPQADANRVEIDSRAVGENTLFAALVGARSDGHDYIESALDAGATVVLVERADAAEVARGHEAITEGRACIILVRSVFRALQGLACHQRDLLDMRNEVTVIGVTGSTGKTSTKEFIASILASKKNVIATRGNQNNELGAPLTMLRVTEDTEVLVVEMGMRGKGQVRELAKMARPHYGVVSTLGSSHIELLGSREEIAHAKAELFEELPQTGVALYRYEEDFRAILEQAADCEHISVGMNEAANVVLDNITSDAHGCSSARITGPFGSFTFDLHVPGEHHIINASFGIIIGARLGIDNETLAQACSHATLSGMRFARILDKASGLTFINDAYNANPTSMAGACRTFAHLATKGKRIAVLGDMLELGEYAPEAHRLVGEMCAQQQIDVLFAYGDYSQEMAEMARQGKMEYVYQFELGKIDELCQKLAELAQPEDLILLKASRGCALEQIIEKMGAYRAS